jgi:hypothetical protein
MNPLTKLSQSIALINTLFTFDDDGETEQNGRGKMVLFCSHDLVTTTIFDQCITKVTLKTSIKAITVTET